ncbi:PAS domain-containing protein [Oceanibaculum nanhaiense]|uniref:PAS domain-containing protein n=1 Tax=Oceanibaculum nanhaiense TaxID=1909734 RepID=UPI0032EEFE22
MHPDLKMIENAMENPKAVSVEEPQLQKLLAHWHEIRGDRALPARADLDPVLLPFPLDRLYLIEVRRDPEDYIIRIAGETVQRFYRGPVAGRSISDVTPRDFTAPLIEHLSTVSRTQRPAYAKSGFSARNSVFRYSRLVLPFGEPGRTTHLLGAVVQYFSLAELIHIDPETARPLTEISDAA